MSRGAKFEKSGKVKVDAVVYKERDLALLLDVGLDELVWMPISQMSEIEPNPCQVEDKISFKIPDWLAREMELV